MTTTTAPRRFRIFCSRLGHDVRTVYDGTEALLAAGAFRPDLMLLDIGLPTISGYEVCRLLRQQAWAANMTIVAMTGWGDQEAQRKSQAAGFDRHLVKPIDEASLVTALQMARPNPGEPTIRASLDE